MNAYYQYQLDAQRRSQLMQEAENTRRAQQAQGNDPKAKPVYAGVLAELGRQLVHLGRNLQEQYETPGGLVTDS